MRIIPPSSKPLELFMDKDSVISFTMYANEILNYTITEDNEIRLSFQQVFEKIKVIIKAAFEFRF